MHLSGTKIISQGCFIFLLLIFIEPFEVFSNHCFIINAQPTLSFCLFLFSLHFSPLIVFLFTSLYGTPCAGFQPETCTAHTFGNIPPTLSIGSSVCTSPGSQKSWYFLKLRLWSGTNSRTVQSGCWFSVTFLFFVISIISFSVTWMCIHSAHLVGKPSAKIIPLGYKTEMRATPFALLPTSCLPGLCNNTR